jgi:hypothetical protein
MFFTRVFRPYMSIRWLGVVLLLFGGWYLWNAGWLNWHPYVVLVTGLIMALYVRKLVVDENERHIETITGIFPFLAKHIHPAHQLRSIKLSVSDRDAKSESSPLRPWPIFRASVLWNSGRWGRLMSGRRLNWIEKRTYSVASALGLNVEMTDGYKRYRDKIIGKE